MPPGAQKEDPPVTDQGEKREGPYATSLPDTNKPSSTNPTPNNPTILNQHGVLQPRRIGSIATSLSLPVGRELEPPRWRTLVELDRKARSGEGWVDKAWGVAWPYPKSELLAVVAS